MKELSEELLSLVMNFNSRFKDIANDTASKKIRPDKWTLKEILGHLIDSASNNQQRFVRLQIVKELVFPPYDAETWLGIERINLLDYKLILSLWLNYNILLANIIKSSDPAKLENYWKKDEDKISLKDLMIDYVRHLKEHLVHFEKRYVEVQDF
jgi:hypothetical protein